MEQESLKKIKASYFIDVGANVGKYSIIMSRYCKKVIAVEPNPVAYTLLLRNIRWNNIKNVITYNVAAWDKDGENVIFHLGDGADGTSSIFFKPDRYIRSISVKTKTIDSLISQMEDVEGELVVKIDTEGAEVQVLRGAEDTVSRYRPVIMIEIRNENLDTCKSMLNGWGYVVVGPANAHPVAGNYLAIPKEKYEKFKNMDILDCFLADHPAYIS